MSYPAPTDPKPLQAPLWPHFGQQKGPLTNGTGTGRALCSQSVLSLLSLQGSPRAELGVGIPPQGSSLEETI